MNENTLVLYNETKSEILSSFGLETKHIDNLFIDKERDNILDNIEFKDINNTIFTGAQIKQLLSSGTKLTVEIPEKLQEAIKNGNATFMNSNIDGCYTPNIQIKGESGIQGQAYLKPEADITNFLQSVSNIAMYASMQQMQKQLDEIDEKINKVLEGQHNDRMSDVIGSFQTYFEMKREGNINPQEICQLLMCM